MAATPSSRMRLLARKKLDLTGNQWRELLPRLPPPPSGGWIAAVREALGMPLAELAKRMGVRPTSVAKAELSEQAGTIQINTLRRAAEAMGCELIVAMVPREPLQTMVNRQRLEQYRWMLDRTAVHMRLEDQPISDDVQRHLLEQAEAAIPDNSLWRGRGG